MGGGIGFFENEQVEKTGIAAIPVHKANLLAEIPGIVNDGNTILVIILHHIDDVLDVRAHHAQVYIIVPGDESAVPNCAEQGTKGNPIGNIVLVAQLVKLGQQLCAALLEKPCTSGCWGHTAEEPLFCGGKIFSVISVKFPLHDLVVGFLRLGVRLKLVNGALQRVKARLLIVYDRFAVADAALQAFEHVVLGVEPSLKA